MIYNAVLQAGKKQSLISLSSLLHGALSVPTGMGF